MSFRVHIKTAEAASDLREVLQSSPDILLGVSDDAANTLAELGIKTVYDLALATLFGNAAEVVRAADDPDSVFAQHGSLPADVLTAAALALPLDQAPDQATKALIGVDAALANTLSDTLGVDTIRDLALWPPYLVAQKLVMEAFSPQLAPDYDPEDPSELVPQTGDFATGRVRYTSTVLIHSEPASIIEWNGGPIDVTSLAQVGFSHVAFGAILTFTQSWTPKAVALGQLLHSLPLAPGESTRLTVVDWTRRVAASTDESIAQSEALSASMNQGTAISEVTNAVAREFQSGSSVSGSTSTTASAGTSGLLGFLGGDASVGGSAGVAGTYTTSNGSRSESASAIQNISSRTQQNSALARTRRAAIVSEVSESQSENITTRVVVNNNHMHALSLEYYEVVQTYQTETRLSNIERCIFIPMRLVNFRNEQMVRRYLPILVRTALDRETRDLLQQLRQTVVLELAFDRFATAALANLRTDLEQALAGNAPAASSGRDGITSLLGPLALSPEREKRILLDQFLASVQALQRAAQADANLAMRRGVVQSYDRVSEGAFEIDREALVLDAAWDSSSTIKAVTFRDTDSTAAVLTTPGDMTATSPKVNPQLGAGLMLGDLASISVTMQPPDGSSPSDFVIVPFHLLLQVRSRTHWLKVSFVVSRSQSGEVTLAHVHAPVDVADIANRLMAEQLYYSQQIWMRADRQALVMQLANCMWRDAQNRPVRIIDYLEPTPVTIAGNYVAFRFTYENDEAWQVWKKREQQATPRVDLIPMPSGGVFAEAVLSECNAAEKLDATRFWRWEESPIPNVAPQIADATAGQHTLVNAPTPGSLPSPVLTMQPVPALPTLDGSAAVLKYLAVAKLFNDMSGSDITGKLLDASIKASKQGDIAAMKQATDTLASIEDALASAFKSAMNAGPKLIDTAKGLGSVLNLSGGAGAAGGGGGAGGTAAGPQVLQAAADAFGGGEGAVDIGAIADAIGPVVEGLAGALAV